jgi:tetratricopeptide (TPR) repeat protein
MIERRKRLWRSQRSIIDEEKINWTGSMETMQTKELFTGTVGDELDRLEIPASRIGSISSQQAMELLQSLDAVYERIQTIAPGTQSRRLSETQFEGILAKLRAEPARFLRDLGGAQVMRQARAERNPPEEHEWWYLDLYLAEKRRASLKRYLTTGSILLVVFVVLTIIYNNFLAPDPMVTAIYGFENNARDHMMRGELSSAQAEVDKALELNPQEPTMLVLKGVIQEELGKPAEAEQAFTQSEQILQSREAFLLTRGQAYLYINLFEKALADGREIVRVNPDSAQGHLLAGQSMELLGYPQEALESYSKAFDAAEKTGQTELAAISRTRSAMLLQTMNTMVTPPVLATETP